MEDEGDLDLAPLAAVAAARAHPQQPLLVRIAKAALEEVIEATNVGAADVDVIELLLGLRALCARGRLGAKELRSEPPDCKLELLHLEAVDVVKAELQLLVVVEDADKCPRSNCSRHWDGRHRDGEVEVLVSREISDDAVLVEDVINILWCASATTCSSSGSGINSSIDGCRRDERDCSRIKLEIHLVLGLGRNLERLGKAWKELVICLDCVTTPLNIVTSHHQICTIT